MARFEINYLTCNTEYVNATEVGYDADAADYMFRSGDRLNALIPARNVVSIHRQDDQTEEEAAAPRFHERAIQAEAKLKAFMDKRYRIESERKAALLDALGMDQTRDWDDILNAARGLRGQLNATRERDANTS
jgi:hypothetical protein